MNDTKMWLLVKFDRNQGEKKQVDHSTEKPHVLSKSNNALLQSRVYEQT